jgi:adenine-specific DNA glycosylase
MKGFLKIKDTKFKFQLLSIILFCILIPGFLFLRKRKDVVLNNLYEEFIIKLPGISSLANILENEIPGSFTSNKTKLFYLAKYFVRLPYTDMNLLK